MHEISERAAEWQRKVERGRFAGDDPAVPLTPRLAQAEVVARTLAAQRSVAALTLGAEQFYPGEELAEEALRGALDALRTWNFGAARARLDEAAIRARDAAGQQRITLLKALTRHLAAIVYVPLAEKQRLDLAAFDEALRGLDLLDEAERQHYRDELDRLLALREAAAKGDPFLDASWTLLRAQLAIGGGQDEAALLWLLRIAARHLPPVADDAPDRYLADLVARARAQILALLEPPVPDADPKPPEGVRPRELLNALTARLGVELGRDLAGGPARFALVEYIPSAIAEADGGRGTDRRGGKAGA